MNKIYDNKKGEKPNAGQDVFQEPLFAWALRALSGPAVREKGPRTPQLVFQNRKRLLPAWKLLVGLGDSSGFQGTPDRPTINYNHLEGALSVVTQFWTAAPQAGLLRFVKWMSGRIDVSCLYVFYL